MWSLLALYCLSEAMTQLIAPTTNGCAERNAVNWVVLAKLGTGYLKSRRPRMKPAAASEQIVRALLRPLRTLQVACSRDALGRKAGLYALLGPGSQPPSAVLSKLREAALARALAVQRLR